jgi:hypothetical protein
MNRKIAVAAIVGGLMHTMGLLRGQEIQPAPTRIRPPVGALPPPEGTATLTQAVVDDLQRQITALAGRVDVLAQAQANSVGFTKVGNDFVFAPASGNVEIKAPMMLTIQGAATVRLLAGALLEQKGGMIKLN